MKRLSKTSSRTSAESRNRSAQGPRWAPSSDDTGGVQRQRARLLGGAHKQGWTERAAGTCKNRPGTQRSWDLGGKTLKTNGPFPDREKKTNMGGEDKHAAFGRWEWLRWVRGREQNFQVRPLPPLARSLGKNLLHWPPALWREGTAYLISARNRQALPLVAESWAQGSAWRSRHSPSLFREETGTTETWSHIREIFEGCGTNVGLKSYLQIFEGLCARTQGKELRQIQWGI